jgi:hypothetical protein
MYVYIYVYIYLYIYALGDNDDNSRAHDNRRNSINPNNGKDNFKNNSHKDEDIDFGDIDRRMNNNDYNDDQFSNNDHIVGGVSINKRTNNANRNTHRDSRIQEMPNERWESIMKDNGHLTVDMDSSSDYKKTNEISLNKRIESQDAMKNINKMSHRNVSFQPQEYPPLSLNQALDTDPPNPSQSTQPSHSSNPFFNATTTFISQRNAHNVDSTIYRSPNKEEEGNFNSKYIDTDGDSTGKIKNVVRNSIEENSTFNMEHLSSDGNDGWEVRFSRRSGKRCNFFYICV